MSSSKTAEPANSRGDEMVAHEPTNENLAGTGDKKGALQAYPFRTSTGTLLPNRSSFTVSSGVLLWGHILPMHYGSVQGTAFTNNAATAPEPALGGTIIQDTHTFRSAARVGEWKIRRYLSDRREEEELDNDASQAVMEHTGWVICHEDIDPIDLLRRAKAIGAYGNRVSRGDADSDEDVLFIGRYDWDCPDEQGEFEGGLQTWAGQAIGPVMPRGYYVPRSNVRSNGYLAVVDAEEWGLDFLRAYKRDCENVVIDEAYSPVERVFEKPNGQRFGAYVRMPGGEYEFAWLVFSGQKHPQHDADELVAIVYDGIWVYGRATVVGGAAYAMLPTQEQGASQAVEDVEALQASNVVLRRMTAAWLIGDPTKLVER